MPHAKWVLALAPLLPGHWAEAGQQAGYPSGFATRLQPIRCLFLGGGFWRFDTEAFFTVVSCERNSLFKNAVRPSILTRNAVLL